MSLRGVLLSVSLFATAAEASGTAVDASSTIVVASQPDWRDGTVRNTVPAFQRVAISAYNDDSSWLKDLQFNVSAWGGSDTLAVHRTDAAAAGDVDVAYVQGKILHRRLTLTVGRQLVAGGSARLAPMDGLNGEWRIWKGLGIQAYGGAPAVPRFAVARGDAIAGGRVFWRRSYSTEAGISFNEVLDHGLVARQEMGVDVRYVPLAAWTFNGFGLWSLVERRVAEGELSAQWQPIATLLLTASYRRTAPDLFIPRSSIFSVFAETRRDEAGGGAAWRPQTWIDFYADGRAVSTDSGGGLDASGRVHAKVATSSTVGAQFRVLHIPANGYTQGRLWLQHQFLARLSGTLSADAYLLNHSINGRTHSLSGSASGSYAFAPNWRTVISATVGETPFFSSQFQLLAKLVYDFSVHIRERRP